MRLSNIFKPVGIFILSFIYLYLIRAKYSFISDEGVFSYGAVRILNGDILYKDFYETNSPANYFLLVFLFKIFGINTSVTMYTTFVIFGLIAVVIYLVAKEIKLSSIFSFLLIAFFIIDNPSKFMLFSHHWVSTLCALISFLFFLRSSLFLSGLFSGLTMTFFYPKGITVLTGMLLCFIIFTSEREQRFKGILSLLSGFILPVISFILYFITKGALSEFLYYWLISPFKGYRALHTYPSYYYPAKYYLNVAYQQKGLIGGFISSLPVFFLGYNFFISAGIFIGILLLKGKNFFEEYKEYLKVFIITVFVFISCLYRPDDLRIAFISPFINITFICALNLVIDYFRDGFRRKATRVTLYFFALFVPIITTSTQLITNAEFIAYAHNAYEKINTPRGEILVDRRESAEIKEFSRYLGERRIKEFFVYHCLPSIYFIFSLENPTKYNCLGPYYNSPKDLQDALEQLREKGTDYIIFLPFYLYQKEQFFPIAKDIDFVRMEKTDPILGYIRENFVPIIQYKFIRRELEIAKKTVEGYMISLYKKRR